MFGTLTGCQKSDLYYPRRNQDRHNKAFPRKGIINDSNEKLLEADYSDNKIFQQDNAFT